MKPWPEDGSTVSVEELLPPVITAIRALYRLEQVSFEAAYDGYSFDDCSVAAVCLQPDEKLSKENLEASLEHGRDPLQVTVEIAFQLGFIQGRRSLKKEVGVLRELLSLYIDNLPELGL